MSAKEQLPSVVRLNPSVTTIQERQGRWVIARGRGTYTRLSVRADQAPIRKCIEYILEKTEPMRVSSIVEKFTELGISHGTAMRLLGELWNAGVLRHSARDSHGDNNETSHSLATLAQLHQRVYLDSIDPEIPVDQIEARLRKQSIALINIGESALGSILERLLTEVGFRSIETLTLSPTASTWPKGVNPRPEQMIACINVHAPQALSALNSYCIKHKITWLPIHFWSQRAFLIGPMFVRNGSGCYECLRLRLLSTSEFPDIEKSLDSMAVNDAHGVKPVGALVAMAHLVASIAGACATHHALGIQSNVTQGVIEVDNQSLATSFHRLLRVPGCKACARMERGPMLYPWGALPTNIN